MAQRKTVRFVGRRKEIFTCIVHVQRTYIIYLFMYCKLLMQYKNFGIKFGIE